MAEGTVIRPFLILVCFSPREKLEEKAKLYEKMTKGDFPGKQMFICISLLSTICTDPQYYIICLNDSKRKKFKKPTQNFNFSGYIEIRKYSVIFQWFTGCQGGTEEYREPVLQPSQQVSSGGGGEHSTRRQFKQTSLACSDIHAYGKDKVCRIVGYAASFPVSVLSL